MKDKKEMHIIYETDDIDQARLVASRSKNVSVVYHNPNRTIPPILTFKIDGRSYKKWNPEYIQYLKRKHPGISDKEIAKCIEMALEQSNSKKTNKDNTCYSSKKIRKKIVVRKKKF